jgi:hypothetical protein
MRLVILRRHSDGAGLTVAMGSPHGTSLSETALRMELLSETVRCRRIPLETIQQ